MPSTARRAWSSASRATRFRKLSKSAASRRRSAEILVGLLLSLLELAQLGLGGGRRVVPGGLLRVFDVDVSVGVVVRLPVHARSPVSASSTTSASTISSSESSAVSPLAPLAPVDPAAWACW